MGIFKISQKVRGLSLTRSDIFNEPSLSKDYYSSLSLAFCVGNYFNYPKLLYKAQSLEICDRYLLIQVDLHLLCKRISIGVSVRAKHDKCKTIFRMF